MWSGKFSTMGTEMEQSTMQELLIQEVIEIAGSQIEIPLNEEQFIPQGTLQKPETPDQLSLTPEGQKTSARQYKRCCKPKLVDALGYMYNVKRVRGRGVTDWQCTVRGKSMACRASFKQKNGGFIPGPQPHLHMAESQMDTKDLQNNKDEPSQTSKKRKKAAKMTKAKLATVEAKVSDDKRKKSKKSAKVPNIVQYMNRKPRLVDKRSGFTYCIKRVQNEITTWKCVLRDTTIKCPAVLIQEEGQFVLGSKSHNHKGGIQVDAVPKIDVGSKVNGRGNKSIAEQAWEIAGNISAAQTGHSAEPPAADPQMPMLSQNAQDAGYRLLQSSSQRCRPRLVDSQGYTYNIKRVRQKVVDWQCTVRNKKMHCPVYLKESQGVITPGPHQHIHSPEPGAVVKSLVKAEIRTRAVENLALPTKDIVSQVLMQQESEEPAVAILSPVNLARMAYRAREVKKKKYFNNFLCGLARFHEDGRSTLTGEDIGDCENEDDSDSDDEQ
ncbi:uncharacterized protein LOC110975606 isoform X1 [Acanthaster planci]|uniref:Uncharacterized protein LOC110975606 isoform X1 n=1 Tax=Acanthaster planci TaxID=133434 RepID=A0A8B7XSQ0_ACAPL|nr:uncharacterized protein LOC110975606 isoform X1 [Acanthaster planci]XP_022083894.1 uncharacterized protein LOC110975606 isoform X1 [Acanthaster planci]